jgi:Mn-containing catalase
MAYNTEELFNKGMEAIEKHKLFFIEDIIALLPCRKSTFYEHFPNETDYYKRMFEALEKNRIEIKSSMRSKWYKSTAPALQLALYKLIASPDEHQALQMNYVDHTTKGDKITPPITWVDGDTE